MKLVCLKPKLVKQTIFNNFLECRPLVVVLFPASFHKVHVIFWYFIFTEIGPSSSNNMLFKNYILNK